MKKLKILAEIENLDSFISENYKYTYQAQLTEVLDAFAGEFTQEKINEIVLWKVNRYALLSEELFSLINKIKKSDRELNEDFTKEILSKLLATKTKGIQLPMASTILRFKNPYIYQIIDQRVYRIIMNENLKLPRKIEDQIIFYLNYLQKLREVCIQYFIPFEEADRVLYALDKEKEVNGEIKIKY